MSGFPDTPRALDRQALEQAFRSLSRHLGARDIRAHIYVVGGAAMALAHRASRSTLDVDALALDHRAEVLAVAGEVAREQRLPPDWLNDAVRRAPWSAPGPDARAAVVYDSPHLVVTGASAEHLLAMKVQAFRARDEPDIEFLIRRLGISTLQHVEAIQQAAFPHDPIPKNNVEVIQGCLQRVRDERAFAGTRWPRSSHDSGPIR